MDAEFAKTFGLDGRVAVVTGAASGIGRACAQLLAEAGARLVIADINETGLAETASLILQASGQAPVVSRTDVTRRAEVEALADLAMQDSERVDIWVNVAGAIVTRPVLEVVEEEVERLLSVNLKSVYWGCAAAGRVMNSAESGVIINISSGGGESAVPGLSIYSMTKKAFEKGGWGHGHRRMRVAAAAMTMRVSATGVSCS